jgi:hypothetical protein
MLMYKVVLLLSTILFIIIHYSITFTITTMLPPTKLRHEKTSWAIPRNVKKFEECDIPCYFNMNVPLVGGQIIYDENGRSSSFMHTMEGPRHYPRTKTKGPYDALSTVSMESTIPLPYFSWAEYSIQSPPVDFDDSIKGASFIARNCRSLNNREGLLRELIKETKVDSLSSCLNNAHWPDTVSRSNKNEVMRRYLFHFAFENECSDDYMTEKLWGALESGSLPVYYGAPNVLDYVPEHSIIDVNQYMKDGIIDYKKLGNYLTFLSTNKQEYEKYHKWRAIPLSKKFTDMYDFTRVHSICRACRWNLARHEPEKYKFDHKTQKLT